MLTRLRHARDEGFTLIEMLIVIVLVGILGAIVTTAIADSMKTTRQDYNREFSVTQLQTALERISRDLRVADPAQKAAAQDVVVDVYRNAKCVRTEYKVSGTNLVWESWTFGSTCATYPSTTGATDTGARVLVPNINTASSGSSGTYFSFFNDQGTGGSSTAPSPYTRAQIVVTANQREGRAAVTLQSSIQFRNHS
jgi:prepilin-type N-terminal cleavage/methylation domain-containing protein